MNLAVFQNNLADALVNFGLLFRLQQVEVQVRREVRQIVKEHCSGIAFECQHRGKQSIGEDVFQYL